MVHILVITESNEFTESLRVVLSEKNFRLHYCPEPSKAFTLLKAAMPKACIVDAGTDAISALEMVKQIRETAPSITLLVCSQNDDRQWEEDAFIHGADFILHKPLRGALLQKILERQSGRAERTLPPPVESGSSNFLRTGPTGGRGETLPASALEIMRDFSRILSYSLDLKSFVHQFSLKLREIISVNRIAILLRKPAAPFSGIASTPEDSRLDCVCSIGIETDLFQYFQLNLNSGIGGTVSRSGQILKADFDNNLLIRQDEETRREFEVLGCQVAIPIVDRERCLGVALLGGRLTGSQFSDEELQLLFHLMEELGLAVRNNRLHEELANNHELISDVISQFRSGCLVISQDLTVLHANPALVEYLQKKPGRRVEFSDLPTKIASRIYDVVQHGKSVEPFMFSDFPEDNRIFRVSIFPLKTRRGHNGTATMVLMEDFTQVEKAKETELEAQNAQTIALIAERFAHEIRNALVPLSTHHQLLDSDFDKDGFRSSLDKTMGRQINRISRFADQMLLLSRSRNGTDSSASLKSLLAKAFEEASSYCGRVGDLNWSSPFHDCEIRGDLSTLKYAYMEILLNALQSGEDRAEITISSEFQKMNGSQTFVSVDFLDGGKGFSEREAQDAVKPFFTTRNVGIGLGLTVAEKIIHAHGGSLEILSKKDGAHGVRTRLPLS
jgi:signal transduction histidine kinase/DNA-binding NarL/FixJ family response regulator